jgi:hypothetical protein
VANHLFIGRLAIVIIQYSPWRYPNIENRFQMFKYFSAL